MDSEPSGTVDGSINYDPDTEIVAAASTLVPAFWLSVFHPENLTTIQADGADIRTLVTAVTEAQKRLAARRELLDHTFPQNVVQLNDWTKLLDNLPSGFLKVDAAEIWALDPRAFEDQLPRAVRWFETRADDDFQRLKEIADLDYDSVSKSITVDDSVKHNLHGYPWVRAVPWDDDEPAESQLPQQSGFEENEASWRETVKMIAEMIGFSEEKCAAPGCKAKALEGRACCPEHEFLSDEECMRVGCKSYLAVR